MTCKQNVRLIREISGRLNKRVGVWCECKDQTCIGTFADGKIMLEKGQSFQLDMNEPW